MRRSGRNRFAESERGLGCGSGAGGCVGGEGSLDAWVDGNAMTTFED